MPDNAPAWTSALNDLQLIAGGIYGPIKPLDSGFLRLEVPAQEFGLLWSQIF
jgi:hypothetical protein